MFESKSELIEKIRLGEDSLLETKEVRFTGGGQKVLGPSRESVAQEFAAFANSHGGVLVFGVEDDAPHDIQAFSPLQLDVVETFTREICFDGIKPPLPVKIEKLSLSRVDGSEGAVLRVDVPRSLFVHEAPGGYFHRIGSSKRQIPPDHLARLFQQRSQSRIIRFDEQAVPESEWTDLEDTLWERFATPRTNGAPEDFLNKLGMVREDEDGMLRASVSGILMATKDPRVWLPNAFIQAVAYAGTSIDVGKEGQKYQLDAKDITGPLDQQVRDACVFVFKNMTERAEKSAGRRDLPDFDITAVFEALVNAVAHRDYSMHGAKIRLRLFSDRLELYSPGSIPNTMTVESLPFRQSARNETLASLLAKCPVPGDVEDLETDRSTMMDKRGEGVGLILSRSEKLSGRVPEYRLVDDSELLLTVYSSRVLDLENEES